MRESQLIIETSQTAGFRISGFEFQPLSRAMITIEVMCSIIIIMRSAIKNILKSEWRSSGLPYSPTCRCHVGLSGWCRSCHSPCSFHSAGPLLSIKVARSRWVPNRKSELRNLGTSQRSTNFLAAPSCAPQSGLFSKNRPIQDRKSTKMFPRAYVTGVERGGSSLIYSWLLRPAAAPREIEMK